MALKLGTTSIGAIYKGTTPINFVYKGVDLVFTKYKFINFESQYVYNTLIPSTISSDTVLTNGRARLNTISGNGVIENQQVVYTGGYGQQHCTLIISNQDQKTTVVADGTGNPYFTLSTGATLNNSHKFLAVYMIKSAKSFTFSTWAGITNEQGSAGNNVFYIIKNIGNSLNAHWVEISGTFVSGDEFDVQYNLFDLTLMFGTGNEPTTTSDTRIQALLNRGYISYNTGSYKYCDFSEIEFEPYNLLSLERTQGVWGDAGNTAKRNFAEDKYYLGVSANNYGYGVVSDLTISGDTISFKTNNLPYGVGLPVRVEGGKTYTFSNNENNEMRIGFYNKDGYLISYPGGTSFTAPQNAYWALIVLSPTQTNTLFTYSKILFSQVSDRTGYAPHVNFGKPLPLEYQQVEYIESSGTQYIDTGYIFTSNNQKIISKFYANYSSAMVCGSQGSSSARCNIVYIPSATQINFGIGSQSGGTVVGTLNISQINEIECVSTSNTYSFKLNGVYLQQNASYSGSNIPSYNFYIFANNYIDSVEYPFNGKLYYFAMYDNDVLVRNLIPCYRKSDNVIGLYDTVNGVFYTNAGTGTFTKGNDVNVVNGIISLPNTLQLGGAINSHNTFSVSANGYTFTRNVWKVDLGSLTWTFLSWNEYNRWYSNSLNNAKPTGGDTILPNIVCAYYTNETFQHVNQKLADKIVGITGNEGGVAIGLYDTSLIGLSQAEVKTTLNGKYLYYALNTPQTITIPKKHLKSYTFTGNETFVYLNGRFYLYQSTTVLSDIKLENIGTMSNMYMEDLITVSSWDAMDNSIFSNNSLLFLYIPSITSVSDLQTYIKGKTIWYETNNETNVPLLDCNYQVGGTFNTDSYVLPNITLKVQKQ